MGLHVPVLPTFLMMQERISALLAIEDVIHAMAHPTTHVIRATQLISEPMPP